MLFQRVISAVIVLTVLLAAMLNDLLLNISLAFVIVFSLYEIYKPFGLIKKLPLALLGFSLGLCFALGPLKQWDFTVPLICGYVILMFLLAIYYHKTIHFPDLALALFTTIYIALFLSHIRLLKSEPNGTILIYCIFIGAWVTDTGAYFGGVLFGRHKLIPEISPKKTIEGAIGGTALCVAAFAVFAVLLHFVFQFRINFINAVILGFIASITAEVGDIAASMIKRELGIKDYGRILPGHGGILDRFDSVIFVAPVVYYLLKILPII